MSMKDYLSFFMPASSASSTPWEPPGAVPGALPDPCPGTPPVGVSAPGPLDTPAPVPKNSAATKPDLLRALTSQSLQAVEQVLADDPDAVNEPFWEQQCEPPLCRAIREGCSPAIVAELLRRGADVDAVDARACSPYMLLQQAKARLQTMAGPRVAQYEWDVVEGLLLEAGAKTAAGNAYVQGDTWGMQEDTWGAAPLPFDAELGTFLPPPMPWNHACIPPLASQY